MLSWTTTDLITTLGMVSSYLDSRNKYPEDLGSKNKDYKYIDSKNIDKMYVDSKNVYPKGVDSKNMTATYMDSKHMDWTLSSLDTEENTMAKTGNIDEFNHEGSTGFKEQVQSMENIGMDYDSTRAFTNQVRIYYIFDHINL